MGFRQAAVLASVCFFIGVLFVCFTVDQKLLFGELAKQDIEDGFFFYTTFFNAPQVIRVLLHTMMGVGALSLITKLHKWDDTATFFDGSALACYVFTVGVYLTVTIPALRTIVDPIEGVDTYDDRVEAMRVLSAGNVIMMVLLGAVLALQAGEQYVRKYIVAEVEKEAENGKGEEEVASAVGKKDKKTKKNQ